ncbi:MAG: (deoxy)nucleoside triphosphate pyrophosphohydrolase [Proteobacteria bacterium]|nr:(deoxy)nucleoside triphosphate pyrophosphohydrolase [Pseudomonadota bacterium]
MTGAQAGGPPLEVVAGALCDAHGRVLIAERPAGKSFAGRWEFPGGKRAPGEAPRAALARELAEELGIEVVAAAPLLTVRHRYPGAAAAVHIDCWRVTAWQGTPAGLDGQRLRWCTREQLLAADILEADRPLVTALLLPPEFVRVPADEPLAEHVPAGPRSGRVAWLVEALPADLGVVRRLEEHGDLVFVLDPRAPPAGGAGSVYSRPHAVAHDALGTLTGRLLGSPTEAARAAAEGADFLLLPARAAERAPLSAVAEAGLPWYLDEAAAALEGAAGATGRYRPARPIAIGRL